MWRTSGRAKAGAVCLGAGEAGEAENRAGGHLSWQSLSSLCRMLAWPGLDGSFSSCLSVSVSVCLFSFFLSLLLLLLLLFAVTVAVLCCVRRRLSQICDETGTVNCGNLCCQRPSVCFPRYNSLDFQCLGSAVRFFFSFLCLVSVSLDLI